MNNPIGIFDSGVGGFSVWQSVNKLLPHESTVYIADSKNSPYGVKNKEKIYKLARKMIQFLLKKNVKLIITYPASTGRNFVEVLRVLDSLQLTANYSVATPADWKAGEDVIVVPAIKTEDAISKFPKGLKVIKPYLRYTPQPNK